MVEKKKRRTKAELSTWSDQRLVNAYFDKAESTSHSIIWQEILERMHVDGYTDHFWWIYDTPNPIGHAAEKKKYTRTPKGRVLKAELMFLYEHMGFSKMKSPETCKRFCSEAGRAWNMTEEELSESQQNMLNAIRDQWQRQSGGKK